MLRRHIQKATATGDLRLSLVRIFDIALWFSHPAAGVEGAKREITVHLRDHHPAAPGWVGQDDRFRSPTTFSRASA
jgi:hypothetical protein